MQQQYQPTKCSMKECAFPLSTCNVCICNRTIRGARAFVWKDPKAMYGFMKDVSFLKK